MLNEIKVGLEIIVPFVVLIVWAIRLEGKVMHSREIQRETQKDVDVVRDLLNSAHGKLVEQISDMRESLARIEGYLKIKDE